MRIRVDHKLHFIYYYMHVTEIDSLNVLFRNPFPVQNYCKIIKFSIHFNAFLCTFNVW